MGDDGDFDIDAMLEAPYEKEVNLAALGNVLRIVMLCICLIHHVKLNNSNFLLSQK